MMREALQRLTGSGRFLSRTIRNPETGDEYLSRWYLRGAPRMADGSYPFDENGNTRAGAITDDDYGMYIHRFHRSDDDRGLHNHPAEWGASLILAGGYVEERRASYCRCGHDRAAHWDRRMGGKGWMRIVAQDGKCGECIRLALGPERGCEGFHHAVVRRTIKPGMVNIILAQDFHRVELLEEDAWSLFITGPKTKGWGFWDRATGEYTAHETRLGLDKGAA